MPKSFLGLTPLQIGQFTWRKDRKVPRQSLYRPAARWR